MAMEKSKSNWIFAPLIGVSAAISLAAPTDAAEIRVFGHRDGVNVIAVVGEIQLGDDEKFKSISGSTKKAIVALHSPGGNLSASLAIGGQIQSHGYYTAVLKNSVCASSCALAWLSGRQRFMDQDAKIGFHAAYLDALGQKQETGAGNALVGAYLARLGISDQAIFIMTSAGPSEITWLSANEFNKQGIPVQVFPEDSEYASVREFTGSHNFDATSAQLGKDIGAEIKTIYSDFSPPVASPRDAPVRPGLERFASGDIEFNCTIRCSFGFGLARPRLELLFRNGSWAELQNEVTATKMNWDLSYYYLGTAARQLGYYEAAKKYLERSVTLSQTASGRCNYLINNCSGHSLPIEASNELAAIVAAERHPSNSPRSDVQALPTAGVSDCLITAANGLDDGRADPSVIALAVQAKCLGAVQDMRRAIELGWEDGSRREIGDRLDRAIQKIAIQTVLTLRGGHS